VYSCRISVVDWRLDEKKESHNAGRGWYLYYEGRLQQLFPKLQTQRDPEIVCDLDNQQTTRLLWQSLAKDRMNRVQAYVKARKQHVEGIGMGGYHEFD
jgi:hypothetical protein